MKNVRKLTEGAILLAAFAALILITIYIPIVGSILNLVLPLPFIMFSAKNSLKNIMAFFLAAIFISFLAGSFIGVAMMLIYGSVGVVIGYLLQKNKSRTVIMLASSLTFLAGLVISYIVTVAFFKMDIIHEFAAALNESIKNSQDMLKAMGNEEQIKLLKEKNADLVKMIKTYAPSVLIMTSIYAAFLTQLICFPIAKRFGVNVQPWGSIRNLSFPKSLLWYFLIVMGATILVHPNEGTYFYMVIANANYILQMFMVLQGIAFLLYILHQRSVAKGLQVLIAILAFVIPTIHYIIMIVGITDLGFDFRKRFDKKE